MTKYVIEKNGLLVIGPRPWNSIKDRAGLGSNSQAPTTMPYDLEDDETLREYQVVLATLLKYQYQVEDAGAIVDGQWKVTCTATDNELIPSQTAAKSEVDNNLTSASALGVEVTIPDGAAGVDSEGGVIAAGGAELQYIQTRDDGDKINLLALSSVALNIIVSEGVDTLTIRDENNNKWTLTAPQMVVLTTAIFSGLQSRWSDAVDCKANVETVTGGDDAAKLNDLRGLDLTIS